MPGEAAADSPENPCPVRRSGRQAKRTDKLEEFLSTAKRTFRKSAPPSVEGGDPPSQTPTDAETASEASFDGNTEVKAESPERRTRSGTRKQTQRKTQGGRQTRNRGEVPAAVKDETSSGNEEESKGDGPTKTLDENKSEAKKDAQTVFDNTNVVDPQTEQGCEKNEGKNDKDETEDEETEKPAVLVKRGPIRTYINKKRVAKTSAPVKSSPVNKVASTKENKTRAATACKVQKEEEMEESTSMSSSSSSDESDDGGYDPNALYCICRQKHNKRFMICCDRCEEWFHGDCVGITEARGRLMERNGEDYVCPNCTVKKNQVVRPATSALPTGTDKPKAEVVATTTSAAITSGVSSEKPELPKETEPMGQPGLPVQASPITASSTAEEKATDDLGIKGRIEKASNPTGKKKIKIFQPVLQQAAEPKAGKQATAAASSTTAEQKAPSDMEHKVSSIEVDITATAEEHVLEKTEDSAAPKCIGPGCEKNAQPDSVYCGSDCILRHAAAAMKSITEPNQKDKAKLQKSKTKSATDVKRRQETDSDKDYSPDSDEDDEEAHAEEQPPHPSTASWSSDHNYIAVTPEKTPSISTVFNKKSPPKELLPEKEQKVKEVLPASETPASVTPVKPKKKKSSSSPPPKVSKVSPKGKKSSREPSSSKTSKKPITAPSKTNAKNKKSPAQQPSPYPAGPIHVTGALRVTKSSFTIPKKQPQQKESQTPSQSSSSSSSSKSSSKNSSSSSSSHHHHHSSTSKHSHSSSPAPSAAPMPPPPNNQMRQNIRRSLTDILYKRVSDSDDLKMTESEVGKLAYAIEREMFNLCLSTDSKYKNKYRSLMLHLKDPKNKGLFYRVIGGDVTPFRLVRLSSEELLSKEISEWRKTDISESPRSRSKHRHDSTSRNIDMEDAPPTSDADDQDETNTTQAGSSQPGTSEGSSMPDIFSSMLKDTTSEHRTHLFDLNCKICTGQKKEEELFAKKDKLAKKESKPSRQEHMSSRSGEVSPAPQPQSYQHQEAYTYQPTPIVSYEPTPVDHSAPEPQPQVYQEDPNILVPPSAPAPVTPAVSSVTITRRDPRMARHGSGVTVSYTTAPEKSTNISSEPTATPVSAPVAPVDVALKGPLPMPPAPPPAAPPPAVAVPKTTKASSEPPPEGETAIFLHSQEKIWKGFINMQNVAKFVTKAYLVSGSFEHLKEDLPDTIHIGGRISPNTVWDYVGKLKTSLSKELCLIRFHPATEEEEVAYVSLYSYFSSRKRFGVVANNNRRIKDLYLIPLSSKDPLPPKLLPFDGPGLEPARPNLLLGLLICQKDRKRAGVPLDTDEKRSKVQSKDTDETGIPKPASVAKAEKNTRNSLEIPFSTTPPGTPPPISSEIPGSTITPSSVLSFLSSVQASATAASTGTESPSSSSAIGSVASATPLQTILNTLFGKKKHDSEASNSPPDQGGEMSVPPVNILDPIVKQFALSKEKAVVEDEDDRPYDPEEEYDPSNGYNVPKNPARLEGTTKATVQPDIVVNDGDDVAYDPEDESIFDNVKPVAPEQSAPQSDSKSEAQKILESLKQTGQQIIHKQEEQTEALLAQPTGSLMAGSHLLQLGKKVEELVKSSSVSPSVNQKRDPRQRGDPRQVAEGAEDKDVENVPAPTETSPPAPVASEAPESVEPAPDKAQPEDAVKSETLPFMESEKDEVSIPLLGEEVVTDMEINYLDSQTKTKEPEPDKAETEKDKFSIWPNAASILKSSVEAHYGEDKDDDDYYNEPKNSSIMTSAIPVLTQSSTMDTKSHHMPHRIPPSVYDNEYRPPPDIPPPSNFIRSDPMQGQNLHMRPPPMTLPPPMQGLPPMTGPPPMQGHPPPIHIPPPGHGPPPIQGPNVQPFGPPPGSYPSFQNQWPSSQPPPQLPPGPPQNMMPNRGPPPPFPPVAQRGPPPQMFDPSIRPQHGPPGPPPGLPPPSFDPQSSIPPPRFTGPPPPFNLPTNRGPPPPFTGPPPGHFENRLPPPSHFPAPRGPPPNQFGGLGAPPPSMAEPFKQDNSFTVEPHQSSNTVSIYKDQGPPPGPGFRGPPPNQFEDRRGPPSSGDGSGQHFNPHNQYSSRNRSPPHRGSFEEHRGAPSQESRPTNSQPFAGTERFRFDRHSDEPRPVRHSGPLLPTPSDDPRSSPGRVGAHSPELHREDLWRRQSPEVRRRSTSNREDSPRSFSRFEGGHRESSSGPPQLPEERQRETPDERRREREREAPPPGRQPWDRNTARRFSREQEWERGRERDRSREKDRSRGNESERPRDVDGERHREPEGMEKRRERDRDRERERDRGREREPERRDHERDRNRNRDRDRERDRRRDRSRSRERERGKERTRDRDRDRDKDRERDRERRDRSRSRERREDRKDYKHDSSRDGDNEKK